MAYLVSHAGNKVFAANSFLVHSEEAASDLMFRLEYNGAAGVEVRELVGEELKAERARRLPPHLKHLA